MKKFTVTLIGTLCLVFFMTSCRNSAPDSDNTGVPAEAPGDVNVPVVEEPEPEIRVTNNVIYEGVVKPAGISIYMEGTHRLQLEEGKFILLESDSVDLNGYVQEKVEVFGSSRPTVEGGGIVMQVERIQLLKDTSEEIEEDTPTEEVNEDENSETNQEPDEPVEEEHDNNENVVEEVVNEEVPSSTNFSEAVLERAIAMSKDKNDSDQWLQKYCTDHIGFCIPVHRNWWYRSFGATSSTLWHVEMNSETINTIGDGPIVVNLVSGDTSHDGKVLEVGSSAVGYKTWTGDRHFKVSAPVALTDKVQYIVNNLVEYSAE